MKKNIILLIICICTCATYAQNYKEDFSEVKRLFHERASSTQKQLEEYLEQYPYTPYADEIGLMQGVLAVEKDKFKQAYKILNAVNPKNLSRTSENTFNFYMGYTLLSLDDYDKALAVLKPLKKKQNPYFLQATYYIGYCFYKQHLYPQALSEFLSLEELGGYQKIAPYYIVQIYYANGQYDKVYELAEKLLRNYPENDYNDELHRLVGEIYYQKGIYNDAVRHLKAYHELRIKKRKDIVRNDLYLLGISCYKEQMYNDAITYLKQIKQTPADSIAESTCLHLGHSYLRENDLEKAKISYAATIEFRINDQLREEAMYNYVQVTYLQNSALGENITAFNQFIKEYPNSKYIDKVYSLMADMYLHNKNHLAALEALQEIQNPNEKIQQTLQHLRYQVAVDAFLQGERELTLQWCKEIINNEKQSSIYKTDAYYLKAEAEYLCGEYDKTLKSLIEYTKQPHYAQSLNQQNAQYLKAYAYFNKKKYDNANKIFEEYQKSIDPSHKTYTDVLNRRGDCYFYQRKFPEANTLYQQVANLGKTGADYALVQQGLALGLMHKYDQKITVLEQFIKLYPKSDYVDDALYQIARSKLQLEKYDEAITVYKKLLKQYHNSPLGAKASLELAMTCRSLNLNKEAIEAYKQTIQKYPNTNEAYSALDGMEQVYVETNNVSEYIAYTKTLKTINTKSVTQEDSLIYVTAELQYMMNNYEQAAAGFTTYLTRFCPGGRYCLNATYYAANSYYQLEQYDQAKELFINLTDIEGNPYMETACMRVAELSYDNKDFTTALDYFQRMHKVVSNQQMNQIALLGMLRCSYFVKNNLATITHATEILAIDGLSATIRNEALYYRADAYMTAKQYKLALNDYAPIAQEVRTAWGAEAKYRIAEAYYLLGETEKAEKEIMSFTSMQTTHQYWLAKSLILLADINVDNNDFFQAKQYLLALQNNYRPDDEIKQIIVEKLEKIYEVEAQQNIEITENE
jgi:TolA-binding protein